MHPALSVIFFTTASGAGYGLLVWLSLYATTTGDADPVIGLVGFGVALVLITAGLLSSTFHLGHPERAWRAVSQWRSSWLSREGVAAIATYVPALLFAAGWILFGQVDGPWRFAGFATAVLSLITVFCTAMIYRSLKTIRHWHNDFTVRGYLIIAVASGGLWFLPLLAAMGKDDILATVVTTAFLLNAGWIKSRYWRAMDSEKSASDSGTATGLGDLGPVRLLEGPTTSETYVMREMGYRIGRKHSEKLRRLATIFGFVIPLLALLAVLAAFPVPTLPVLLIAALSGSVGVVIERWLFFAEAKHVATLYYGEEFA